MVLGLRCSPPKPTPDWSEAFAACRCAAVPSPRSALLEEQWSPEQIAGYLRHHGILRISHETIYRYIWADKRQGGTLYTHLRGARKHRRKRYRSYDSRGRVAGKRPITARPAAVETRAQLGHWEADTVLGPGRPCILSMVERKTGSHRPHGQGAF